MVSCIKIVRLNYVIISSRTTMGCTLHPALLYYEKTHNTYTLMKIKLQTRFYGKSSFWSKKFTSFGTLKTIKFVSPTPHCLVSRTHRSINFNYETMEYRLRNYKIGKNPWTRDTTEFLYRLYASKSRGATFNWIISSINW